MKHLFLLCAGLSALLFSCGETETNDPAALHVAENLQYTALNEYRRGEEKRSELKEIAQDKSVPDLQQHAKQVILAAEKIDKHSAAAIAFLDQLKRALLEEMGEDLSTAGKPASVVRSTIDPSDPLRISLYNLHNVKATGKTDFLAADSENGRAIVQRMRRIRKEITEAVASQKTREVRYFFHDPDIAAYADAKDLHKQLDNAIAASNVAPDDEEAVKAIYAHISLSTKDWQQVLHDDCPWITAFQLLTDLQCRVLEARADAIRLISSRVSNCGYPFNKIMAITAGAEYVKAGEETEFSVLIAAFDSYKQPVVKITGGPAELVATRDGMGIVRVKAPKSGETTITGTITILNKSGVPKTSPWQKTIVVGKE